MVLLSKEDISFHFNIGVTSSQILYVTVKYAKSVTKCKYGANVLAKYKATNYLNGFS